MFSKELVKGTLRIVVLRLLEREGRMYGYQMNKRAKELTDGNYQLSEGALYPLLQKMVQQGLVTTETEQANGRPRKYYSITEKGLEAARQKRLEFEHFAFTMRRLLDLQTK
ncbi:MAG: PadR family transcriptional regulator [Bacteroidota bacterium]